MEHYKATTMRLLVSHQLLREEYMRAGGSSHYLIIAEALYMLCTETKLLMLLVVCTLLKIRINKVKQDFVLV